MNGRGERGQATVEVALVLPVVAVMVLLVVQAGLLVRDQVLAVHAARAGARAVAVDPRAEAAERAVSAAGLGSRARVRLTGELAPGGIATVTVAVDPVRVPVVGRALGGLRLSERMAALVEEP